MEKIKSVFRSGGSKDDEVMYGTPEPKNIHEDGTSGQGPRADNPSHPEEDPSAALTRGEGSTGGGPAQSQSAPRRKGLGDESPGQLQTEPGAEKKDHGILSQIFNPGGHKYDETRYGTTAHSDRPLNTATTGTESLGAVDNSQIESLPGAEDSGGISRQILNPGGHKYDEQRYGETGKTSPGTIASRLKDQNGRTASSMSIKSGVQGPFAGQADTAMAGSAPSNTAEQTLSDRTMQGTSATEMSPTYDVATSSEPAGQTYTERSFPLSGGATTTTDSAGRFGTDEAVREDQSTASQAHLGRDAGLAGAGVAGAGALAYEGNKAKKPEEDLSGAVNADRPYPAHAGYALAAPNSGYADPSRTAGGAGAGTSELRTSGLDSSASHPRNILGDPFGYHKPDEQPVEGYVHHTQGPHSTEIANMLDPHVPGEFPIEAGEDPHSSSLGHDAAVGGAAVGGTGLGAVGYEATQSRNEPYAGAASDSDRPIPTTTNMRSAPTTEQNQVPTGQEHHYGHDATIAGGTGAAGIAGYEALEDRDDAHQEQPVATGTDTAALQSTAPQRDLPSEPQHRYGRDAAVAGGAGAGGVTGYEALKDRDDTVPTSGGTGPSDSNVASAVDPAVRSQRQPTMGHTTVQPQQSSITSDPATELKEEHHYGRDAAVAGGAAAAGGAGAYALTEGRGDTGPASKTVGPHESNAANIIDPRVQPQPEKMKESPTTGPYKSDMANKADPRVTSDPKKVAEKDQPAPTRDEPHYGRDAAIAGGAGAAAAGAYEAEHSHHKLEKTPAQVDKHERDLQKAREKEAAHDGDKGQKKEGLLHRILHPGHKDKHENQPPQQAQERQHAPTERSAAESKDNMVTEPHTGLPMNVGKYGTGEGGTDGAPQIEGYNPGRQEQLGAEDPHANDGIVIEPHTGLPMNVGKYGSGHGGTDAAPQIPGAHEADPSVAADWDDIKKKNTPY